MKAYDLIIVGGGAAGILCAIEGKKQGIQNILLIEKDPILGGALNMGDYNISSKDELTGKVYRQSLMKQLEGLDITIKLNTMAIKIEEGLQVFCTSPSCGIEKIKGNAIVLANGGKEKGRPSLSMVGDRPAGILTVGMTKKIFNMEHMIPGKNLFIVGEGTLYMIEKELRSRDVQVIGILAKEPTERLKSLTENIYSGYEITSIQGEGRVSGITLRKESEEKHIDCDTIVFAESMISDGLVAFRSSLKLNPETTGPMVDEQFMTSGEGIWACGNGIYIHKNIEEIEAECGKVIDYIKNTVK